MTDRTRSSADASATPPDPHQALRLAALAHELRTPLNAILGFADAMRARLHGPLEPRYADYVDSIHEAGLHLLDLICALQGLAPRQADDARETVAAAVRLMSLQAQSAGVRLQANLPGAPAPIDDALALRQIALILLTNAVKFTPPDGRVVVTLAQEADGLVLTVADSGIGIAPDDLRRLGQPHTRGAAQANGPGEGLGLWLARSLAEARGGGLHIASAPGAGTVAQVRLSGPPGPASSGLD
jgi:cell cycle sensor histidine kinase DivJ